MMRCTVGPTIIDPRLHRIVAAQPYPLLFATISGAHLYGFPSPDSDFDLRGAHVLPLEKVVGLEVRDETVQQEMIVPPDTGQCSAAVPAASSGGVSPRESTPGETPGQLAGEDARATNSLEMDIVSHDVRKCFGLLLRSLLENFKERCFPHKGSDGEARRGSIPASGL